MAADLSEFDSLTVGSSRGCKTCRILAGGEGALSEEDREKLHAALDPTSGLQHAVIRRWLKTRGIEIAHSSIANHRRNCAHD